MQSVFDFVMKNIPASLQRAVVFVCLGGLIVFGGLTTLSRIADAQGTANKAMVEQTATNVRLAGVEQRLAAIEQKQAVADSKLTDIKDATASLDHKVDTLLERSK